MKKNKLRAWDKIKQQWIDLYCVIYSKDGDILAIEDINDNSYGLHQVDLVQYIGQKDKNKKEVYEGDICTYKNKDGVHIGVIKFMNPLNAFRLVFVDRQEFYFVSDENEVIGNIYENPELLEKS